MPGSRGFFAVAFNTREPICRSAGSHSFAILVIISCLAWTPLHCAEASAGAIVAEQADRLRVNNMDAVKGDDGWYFLTPELRSYGQEKFWGADAVKTAAAGKNQDPLKPILDFNQALKNRGIALILVPVPGKVCVYGDKLDARLASPEQLDAPRKEFYALLQKEGVTVIDLLPDLIELRKKGTDAYCRQDTHWSPAAAHLAARKIAEIVKSQPWYAQAKKNETRTTTAELDVTGDMIEMLKEKDAPKERLTLEQISVNGRPAENDPTSPLILMGDSHTLVFHEALLGDHAGLSDLLCAETGICADLVAMRGGGANGPRIALARRKDDLKGKRCIVWCFTAREFTESPDGWRAIPVIKE